MLTVLRTVCYFFVCCTFCFFCLLFVYCFVYFLGCLQVYVLPGINKMPSHANPNRIGLENPQFVVVTIWNYTVYNWTEKSMKRRYSERKCIFFCRLKCICVQGVPKTWELEDGLGTFNRYFRENKRSFNLKNTWKKSLMLIEFNCIL